MRYYILSIWATMLLFSQIVVAASFDCNKAQAPIEKAICNNAELDDADTLLGQRYKELRKALSQSDVKALKKEQRDWLKQRLEICSPYDIACLTDLYQARIDELESRLGIGTKKTLSVHKNSIEDFVLPGYVILDKTEGDLNRDKYPDIVLILKKANEAEIDVDADEPLRPLLLLTRDANNQLQLAERNDHVVLCARCGGMMGDPYVRTAIKNGYFTIEYFGGSGWKWEKYVTFKYVSKKKNWYLHKITNASYHFADPDNVEGDTLTKENFGTLLFTEYQEE